jgi:hypothetical protein
MRELSVLVYKEENAWLAQCLEYDIAAQEESPEKVIEAFKWVFWSHVAFDLSKKRDVLSTISKAPERFWGEWENASPLLTSQLPLSPPSTENEAQSVQEHVRLAKAA